MGDEIRDAAAAREAGVPFGAVAWGYTRLDALPAQGLARVFQRVKELAAVMAGWRSRGLRYNIVNDRPAPPSDACA